MQTIDPLPGRRRPRDVPPGLFAAGETITWVAGLVLAVCAFTDWYAGNSLEGTVLAVIGWHTGTLGKLVFFAGLAVVVLVLLRHLGVELPPPVPEPLVVLALGVVATILVLIRVISIPETVLPLSDADRGVGIWLTLVAALGVIVGGLMRAADEL
jgi:hypothetical protein